MNKFKKILIVAAHPDDEILGCGGTGLKFSQEGHDVNVLFMTDGVSSRDTVQDMDRNERINAAKIANEFMKFKIIEFGKFPDNQMDIVKLLEIVKFVEKHIKIIKPDVVFTHSFSDLNIDHRLTHQAVMTACRPQPSKSVKEIYAFEVASSTGWNDIHINNFTPSKFVDIGDQIEKKLNALEQYNMELLCYPHMRSREAIYNLNKFRGNMVGLNYAEAFEVIRLIEC